LQYYLFNIQHVISKVISGMVNAKAARIPTFPHLQKPKMGEGEQARHK
jgi:hypothetical protein